MKLNEYLQTILDVSFEDKYNSLAIKEVLDNEESMKARGISITDDAMIVESVSDTKVKLVEGSYRNIKIR